MNPVTHVDGWLIWEGGYSRRLTPWEQVLWKLGRLQVVRPRRSLD